MRHDFTKYVKRYDLCQRLKSVPSLPTKEYHPHNSLWPFMQWDINLVRLMLLTPSKKDMMIVVIDYFTKWIEAEALSSIEEVDAEQFFF